MKMNKAVLLAIVSGTLIATGVYADADDKTGQRDGHFGATGYGMLQPGMISGRIARHLELDDAQRETVQNIMSAAQPEIDALREKVRANQEALKAMTADNPEVQNIAISNGTLATEGTLLFARIRGEVDAVLTDEQRAKLADFANRRGDKSERRQRRR